MANQEAKPGFDDLQGLEVAKPSFEELMALERPPEQAGISVFEPELTPTEAGLRTIRQGIKGATLGLSEPVFGASAALTGAAESAIMSGDIKSGEELLKTAKEQYKQNIERQEKFVSEYPVAGFAAETLGSLAPGGLATKIGSAGLEAVTSIPKMLGQAALTGGGTAAVMESAEQLKKAPYEELTIPESARRLGIATAAGAGVGAGLTGAAIGIGKTMTSEPGLAMVQTLLGPKRETQKQYLKRITEIESLPSNEDVSLIMESARERLLGKERMTEAQLSQASDNVKGLESALKERVKEAKGDAAARLQAAQLELASMREDISRAQNKAQLALKEEKRALEKELIDPEFVPHVQRVQESMEALKGRIFEESSKAAELLPKEPFYNRDQILGYIRREFSALTKGAGKAIVPEVKNAQGLLEGIAKSVEEMAPVLNGQEVKGIIKQLDQQVNEMTKGKWGKLADVPLYNVRRQINTDLRKAAPDYGAFMDQNVVPLAELHDQAVTQLPTVSRIESQSRRALREPEVGKLFKQLEEKSGIDTTSTLIDLADKQTARSMKNALVESTPEAQEIKRLETLLDISKVKNFSNAVFNNVKDTEAGQTIIALRREIAILKNKQLQEQEIQNLVSQGQISISEANAMKAGLEQKLDSVRQSLAPIRGDERGAQTVGTILRQSASPVETRQASRLVDALSQLPDAEFGDLFRQIGLNHPEEFERMAENLRIRHAMDMPRTQGSRRVNLYNYLTDAIMNQAGLGSVKPVLKVPFVIAGAYFDEAGGAMAKAYLKSALQLQGIPTASKLINAAPTPMSNKLKTQIAGQIGAMVSEIDPEQFVAVSDYQKPAVVADIQKSKLSPIERSKALTELSNLGMVSGRYLIKLMSDVPVREARAEEFMQSQIMSEKKDQSLREDKPDMLKALSGMRK